MDEPSGMLWCDLINAQLAENKENVPVLFEGGWLNAGSVHYRQALRVVKAYVRKYPGSCIYAPGGVHHIRTEYMRSFVKFFVKTFRPAAQYTPSVEKLCSLPRSLLRTDLALDDEMYRIMRIPYDELTVREQQHFEDRKDMLHEESFGHLTRFDDLNHGFVPGDPKSLRVFRDGLVAIFNDIVAQRDQPMKGRRVREFIPPN